MASAAIWRMTQRPVDVPRPLSKGERLPRRPLRQCGELRASGVGCENSRPFQRGRESLARRCGNMANDAASA